MQYQTVFDIVDMGFPFWPFPAIYIGFILLILGELLLRKLIPAWRLSGTRNFLLYSGLGFCFIWFFQTFLGNYSDYSELRNALQNGKTEVIEGKVENFIPLPDYGHSNESFTVAGHKFEYSDYRITGGFNNTKSHGGPIRSGLYVRINALGNKIARLEVGQ